MAMQRTRGRVAFLLCLHGCRAPLMAGVRRRQALSAVDETHKEDEPWRRADAATL